MNGRTVTSDRFPYLPIEVELPDQMIRVEALLDTGFDGDVVLPEGVLRPDMSPDGDATWYLADGTERQAPYYEAVVRIGGTAISDVLITVLGSEALVGSRLIRHFRVTLDHGRRVIVEP